MMFKPAGEFAGSAAHSEIRITRYAVGRGMRTNAVGFVFIGPAFTPGKPATETK
jgi:hypothetical protein